MVLEEYTDTIGRLAGWTGVCFLLIPAGICLQIFRQKSTENIHPGHFMVGGCITLTQMRRGQLLNAPHMTKSSFIAFILSMFYLSVYTYYHDDRKYVGSLFVKILVIPLLLIAYTYIDEPVRAEKVFGTACSSLIFVLMMFPLYQLKNVMKQKHTGDLSLALAIFGTVHSTLWLLYAISLGNLIEIISRSVFVLMAVPQLVMFLIYPMPKTTIKGAKKSETKSK